MFFLWTAVKRNRRLTTKDVKNSNNQSIEVSLSSTAVHHMNPQPSRATWSESVIGYLLIGEVTVKVLPGKNIATCQNVNVSSPRGHRRRSVDRVPHPNPASRFPALTQSVLLAALRPGASEPGWSSVTETTAADTTTTLRPARFRKQNSSRRSRQRSSRPGSSHRMQWPDCPTDREVHSNGASGINSMPILSHS